MDIALVVLLIPTVTSLAENLSLEEKPNPSHVASKISDSNSIPTINETYFLEIPEGNERK